MKNLKQIILEAVGNNFSKMKVGERKKIAETTTDLNHHEKLKNDKSDTVRIALAQNPHVSDDVLRHLSNNNDYSSIYALENMAKRPHLNKELLERPDSVSQEFLAMHTTDPDIHNKLKQHHISSVRARLAKNTSIHPDLLLSFKNDERPSVRRCVAERTKHIPTLIKLLSDNDNNVRQEATRTLNKIEEENK